MSDGALRYTLPGTGRYGGRTYSMSFHPNSSFLAFTDGEGNTVRLARSSDGAILRTYTQQVNDVEALAFSPSGLLGYGRALDHAVVMSRVSTAPTPAITNPRNGDSFIAPATISITANPSKSSGIARMEFYQDSTKIGEDRTAPYNLYWTGVAAGTYSLTAVETDSRGARTSSGAIRITVISQQNSAPQIRLTSPDNGSFFQAPAQINLSADTTAPAGIARVEFFQNGATLGAKNGAPYSFSWNDVPAGDYTVRAVVTDRTGAQAASDTVTVRVSDAPAEIVRPRVAVLAPLQGSRVQGTPVVLRGLAADNSGVARVIYSLNGAPFQTADGTTEWRADLAPTAGLNAVQVKSVDLSGNESALIARSFTYIVTSPLGLTVSGNGSVFPNLDGRPLEVGKQYALTASPAAGYIFKAWSGRTNSDSPRLIFQMEQGMTLQAEFVPNPFLPLRGIYRGLIESSPPRAETSGALTLNLSALGTFSGRLRLGTSTIALSGRFSSGGEFSRTLVRGGTPLELKLTLHLIDDSQQVTGTISDGSTLSRILAERPFYHATQNPAPQQGRYTAALFPPDNAGGPAGAGLLAMTIDAGGNTRIIGSLPDGTPVAQGGALGKTGTIRFYAPLYRGAGAIIGTLAFDSILEPNGMNGNLAWFRPASAAGNLFSEGFASTLAARGSRFIAPAPGTRVLTTGDSGAVVVNLAQGGLDSPVSIHANLSLQNNIASDSGELPIRLSLNSSTGVLRGTFIHPTTHRPTAIFAIILQKENRGMGYFLANGQSGLVIIAVAP